MALQGIFYPLSFGIYYVTVFAHPLSFSSHLLCFSYSLKHIDENLTDLVRIGYGAAQALLEYGAIVTIISSSENVHEAVKTLKANNASAQVSGKQADVRDEEAFTQTLLSLAPVDHVIFSSVDKIIRGPLKDLDLDDAKHLFGVKFWGSVVVGKIIAKHDFIKPGGSLTLTSGTAALRPGKDASVGGALNGGVLSLTRGLAGELASKRIRVNTVVPGK